MRLVFENAQITGVEHTVKDTVLITYVKMTGQPTQEALELLDIQGAAFEPLKSASLTWDIKSLKVEFIVAGVNRCAIDLNAARAENWKLVRRRDDHGPFLELQFRMVLVDDPLALVQTYVHIGNSLGTLKLTPAQQDLFTKPSEEEETY